MAQELSQYFNFGDRIRVIGGAVSDELRLPLVPEVLGLDRSTAVPVQAEAVQKVSRLWGTG